MPPIKWYTLQLKEIIPESSNTRRFLFDLISDEIFNYEPGQFLTCDLPTGDKRAQRWRSYSIANVNLKNNQIEFCISYKKTGPASEYFFNKINIGDTFKCKGPEGNFILPQKLYKEVYLICTGTGLAPFRPMLQQMQAQGHAHNSIQLIFGTRTHHDIIYKEDITNWNKTIPNFQSHICLSREEINPEMDVPMNSKFYRGYVHTVYQQQINEDNLPKEDYLFMICGWSQMIDEAVLNLFGNMGFARDQIRFELYG